MKEREISKSLFCNGMKVLWELIPNKKQFKSILYWMLMLQFLNMLLPLVTKLLVDQIPTIIAAGSISTYFVTLIVSILILGVLGEFLDKFSLETRFQHFWLHLENYLPTKLFDHLLSLGMEFHDREGMGERIIAVGKGCDSVTGIVSQLHWSFLPSLLQLAVSVLFIFFIDWRLALVFVIPIPAAVYVGWVGLYKSNLGWKEWDRYKEESGGCFIQAMSNIRTVKSFVREPDESVKMMNLREKMRVLDLRISLMNMRYQFWMDVILKVCLTGNIVLSIIMAIKGAVGIGTVIFITATGSQAAGTVWRLVHDYVEISKRMVAVVRLKEILNEQPSIKDSPEAQDLEEFQGEIKLKDVYFTYPQKDQATISGLSLEIPKGKMIALVGHSGTGKTTIFSLLQRLYEIGGGKISVDGRDIKELTVKSWRRLFAPVQQNVDIFSGTVADNIRYACPKADDGKIVEALEAANLGYIINNTERFPKGIQTMVGEKGVKLSGGERQRLGIARAYAALSNGARVLLLDEATSNLDSEAEAAIQKVVQKLRKEHGITVVVIAHRLSTIQMADQICVLEDGRIVEAGDHAKLMKKNGLYAKLAKLQDLGVIRED